MRCGCVDANDPPTPQSPLWTACVRCNGSDGSCAACGGRGKFRVESDPRATVPAWAYRVAQMADAYLDHGLPVIDGGQLDQSNWFLLAANFAVADRERILADRYGTT